MSTNVENPNTVLRDSSGTEKGTGANPVRTDPTGSTTQPVSAASLPLPTGAATATLQTNGNNLLNSIDARIGTLEGNSTALGQALMAASYPVAIASNQSAIPVTGTFWQATQPVSGTVTANAGTGTFTVSGAVTQSGTWTVQPGNTANTTPWLVAGNKTSNGAVPGTNLLGVLPAIATTAAPTYTTGNIVALSTDLSGALRVTGTVTAGNASVSTTGSTPPASATLSGGSVTTAAPTYTTGQMSALSLTTAGALRVDGSGVTQPISAASLPLPTGAATQTTLASILTNTPSLGQALMAASSPVVIASNQSAIPVSQSGAWSVSGSGNFTVAQATAANLNATVTQGAPGTAANGWFAKLTDGTNNVVVKGSSTAAIPSDGALVVAISPNNTVATTQSGQWVPSAQLESSFSPDPSSYHEGEYSEFHQDSAGNLRVRGQALTDEASYRDNFEGSGLAVTLSGTVTLTNGSDIVTGVGSAFRTEVKTGDYVMRTVDANTWIRVASVDSDTQLTLDAPYASTTGTGVYVSRWDYSTVGSGAIAVGSSLLTLGSSTASGNQARICRQGDYGPIYMKASCRVTQRLAAQESIIGFRDDWTAPTAGAEIVFSGTNNRQIMFRTYASAATQETTTWTLPVGANTAEFIEYQIGVDPSRIVLTVNGELAATHSTHIPEPYTALQHGVQIRNNSAAGSNTNFEIDYLFFANHNRIEIANSFLGMPQTVRVIGGRQDSSNSYGYVSTASTTRVPVRASTYTEQTSNAQRSIVSTSNGDNASGNGARTVRLTYYSVDGSGPKNEIITLNGTSAVNTVSTDICFVEKIEVETVGSSGANIGTINLRSSTGGGGSTIWGIIAGDLTTYGAHHYVPEGKICFITTFGYGNTSTAVANGALFQLFYTPYDNGSPLAERPLGGIVTHIGTGGNSQRLFTGAPITVSGPAKIQVWVTPRSSTAAVQHVEFAYYEV